MVKNKSVIINKSVSRLFVLSFVSLIKHFNKKKPINSYGVFHVTDEFLSYVRYLINNLPKLIIREICDSVQFEIHACPGCIHVRKNKEDTLLCGTCFYKLDKLTQKQYYPLSSVYNFDFDWIDLIKFEKEYQCASCGTNLLNCTLAGVRG